MDVDPVRQPAGNGLGLRGVGTSARADDKPRAASL